MKLALDLLPLVCVVVNGLPVVIILKLLSSLVDGYLLLMIAFSTPEDHRRRLFTSEPLLDPCQEVFKNVYLFMKTVFAEAFVQVLGAARENALRLHIVPFKLTVFLDVHVLVVRHLIEGALLLTSLCLAHVAHILELVVLTQCFWLLSELGNFRLSPLKLCNLLLEVSLVFL